MKSAPRETRWRPESQKCLLQTMSQSTEHRLRSVILLIVIERRRLCTVALPRLFFRYQHGSPCTTGAFHAPVGFYPPPASGARSALLKFGAPKLPALFSHRLRILVLFSACFWHIFPFLFWKNSLRLVCTARRFFGRNDSTVPTAT